MADSQISVVVENGKAKASRLSSTSNTDYSSKRWPTSMKEITDPKGPFLPKWRLTFIVSCVFGVLLDPLFLYIPIINDEAKCMSLDTNLKIVAPVFRTVTDIFYILNIILQVYESNNWSYILIDVLAVLPLPHVVFLIFFPKMRGVRSLNTRMLLNFLVLVQYLPRVLRIYILCKEPTMSSKEEIATWVKGVLNLFIYILASHVLGACWYFFSVQRITNCWQHACHIENSCKPSNFDCHDRHSWRNPTLLNALCPVDPPNAKLFDFGIFLDVLQSGILGSTDYPKKFSNCVWWGLRHLSSFGSNLKTSTNTWENLFATLISIIGLLLFLYLLGNLQTYMGSETTVKEQERWTREVQEKRKVEQRIKLLESQIDSWLLKNHLPPRLFKPKLMEEVVKRALERNKDDVDVDDMLSNLSNKELRDDLKNYMDAETIDSWLESNGLHKRFKLEIMEVVQAKRQESVEFDVDPNNILSILPDNLRSDIMQIKYLWLGRLKQVRLLQNVDDKRLQAISEKLQHKRYTKSTTIVLEKKQLEKILFIVDGVVSIEKRYCLTSWELKAGEIYGEELLHWPSPTSSPGNLPMATESVKAKSDIVEALVLEAKDLQSVVSDFNLHISKEITVSSNYVINHVPMLKKVPEFEKMDEAVLKAISAVLERKRYSKGKQIIKENDELDRMFFVTRGTVGVTRSGRKRRELYRVGKVYGKELVDWALDKPETTLLPLSAGTASATADSNVDVLILKETDLVNFLQAATQVIISDEGSRPTTDSESEY